VVTVDFPQFPAFPGEPRAHLWTPAEVALTDVYVTNKQKPSVSGIYFRAMQIYRHFDPACYLYAEPCGWE